MIGQASLTATVAFTYSTSYVTDGQGRVHRQVDAWPAAGYRIDPVSLELIAQPALKYKHGDDKPTANEKRSARHQWQAKQADQLVRAVNALIALSPHIAERMRGLQTSNQPAPEGISHE